MNKRNKIFAPIGIIGLGIAVALAGLLAASCDMNGSNGSNNDPVIPSTGTIADTGGMSGLSSLSFGNGRFFARGSEGVLTSTNGINWLPVDFSATFGNNQVLAIAFTGGRWVAIGGNSTFAVSTNGIAWTHIDSAFFGGTWTWADNIFLRITATGTAHSPDLVNWTEHPDNVIANIGGTMERFAFGNGVWVVGTSESGGSGAGGMAYSTDGISWTAVESSPLTTDIHHLTFANGKFVAINDNEKTLHSTNGIDWFEGTDLSFVEHTFAPWALFSFFGGRFIMNVGHGKIAYSIDGSSWTVLTLFDADADVLFPRVVYGGLTFVAFGFDREAGNPTPRMAYSTDFNDWTDIDLSGIFEGNNTISNVVFGNRRFVALGQNGTIAYSN